MRPLDPPLTNSGLRADPGTCTATCHGTRHATCHGTRHATRHFDTFDTRRVKGSIACSNRLWSKDFRQSGAGKCVSREWRFALALLAVGLIVATRGAAEPPAKPKHWAFQPVVRPALPSVRDAKWCRTPVDYFILARLEQQKL